MTEKTHVVMLLDESSSMGMHHASVVSSFNEYISQLKETTERCYLSLFKFSHRFGSVTEWGNDHPNMRCVFQNRKVKDLYELTAGQYSPMGNTPLLDAVGDLINQTKERLPKEAKVLFVIHTDGQENASTRYDKHKIAKMIQKCEKKRGWVFVYLGEGSEAWGQGYSMGVATSAHYDSSMRSSAMDKLSVTTAYMANNTKVDVTASVVANAGDVYGAAGITDRDDKEATT